MNDNDSKININPNYGTMASDNISTPYVTFDNIDRNTITKGKTLTCVLILGVLVLLIGLIIRFAGNMNNDNISTASIQLTVLGAATIAISIYVRLYLRCHGITID